MLASDIGEIMTYMLRFRQARLGPGQRKPFPNEEHVAQLIDRLDYSDWIELGQIFHPFGYMLDVHEGTAGRPEVGKRTFLLLRDPMLPHPTFGGASPALEKLKENKSEQPRITRTWWIYIWAHHMALMYEGRAVSEVSLFVKQDFKKGTLITVVSKGVDQIERMEIPSEKSKLFAEILTKGDTTTKIPKRVSGFLDGMVEAGLLEEFKAGTYRMTLLAAKEAENCISQGFSDFYDLEVKKLNEDLPSLLIKGEEPEVQEEKEN